MNTEFFYWLKWLWFQIPEKFYSIPPMVQGLIGGACTGVGIGMVAVGNLGFIPLILGGVLLVLHGYWQEYMEWA